MGAKTGYRPAALTRYYNEKRSHMECGHLPPLAETPEEVETLKPSEVGTRLNISHGEFQDAARFIEAGRRCSRVGFCSDRAFSPD